MLFPADIGVLTLASQGPGYIQIRTTPQRWGKTNFYPQNIAHNCSQVTKFNWDFFTLHMDNGHVNLTAPNSKQG